MFWFTWAHHLLRTSAFHCAHSHQLDHITNNNVLSWTFYPASRLPFSNITSFGRVTCPEYIPTRIILFGELASGKSLRGGPNLDFMGQLKTCCKVWIDSPNRVHRRHSSVSPAHGSSTVGWALTAISGTGEKDLGKTMTIPMIGCGRVPSTSITMCIIRPKTAWLVFCDFWLTGWHSPDIRTNLNLWNVMKRPVRIYVPTDI